MLATGTSLQAESFWQYQVPASVYKILIEAKLTLRLFCPYVQYMLWAQKEVNSISILFLWVLCCLPYIPTLFTRIKIAYRDSLNRSSLYEPSCPSVGWLSVWSVGLSIFHKKAGKFHFHRLHRSTCLAIGHIVAASQDPGVANHCIHVVLDIWPQRKNRLVIFYILDLVVFEYSWIWMFLNSVPGFECFWIVFLDLVVF